MPIYAYRCEAGHDFEILGKLDHRDEPTACMAVDEELTKHNGAEVVCGRKVERQMALNAKLFPGADSWRK